jgi:hypothetical protein
MRGLSHEPSAEYLAHAPITHVAGLLALNDQSPSVHPITEDDTKSDDRKLSTLGRRMAYGDPKLVLAARAGSSDVASHSPPFIAVARGESTWALKLRRRSVQSCVLTAISSLVECDFLAAVNDLSHRFSICDKQRQERGRKELHPNHTLRNLSRVCRPLSGRADRHNSGFFGQAVKELTRLAGLWYESVYRKRRLKFPMLSRGTPTIRRRRSMLSVVRCSLQSRRAPTGMACGV